MTPGQLIAGKYRLRRPLGNGAMGTVWAAVNELTEREVALKLLRSQNPDLRRRLLREARACGRLSHRNIVEILDVGETAEGDPFLVMALLKGETLAQRLRLDRRLPIADAVAIAIDIARAIRAAHDAKVIHRDLKPANIFLHREDDVDGAQAITVKVVDFGVSKVALEGDATSTAAGTVLGSPAYMSPEQMQALAIDGRSDLWALGVMLFEMLAGERPFKGRTAGAVMLEILTNPIPRVDQIAPGVGPTLGDIVASCLERDPGRRVATAAELIALLRPFAFAREGQVSTWKNPAEVAPPQPVPPAPDAALQAKAPAFQGTIPMSPTRNDAHAGVRAAPYQGQIGSGPAVEPPPPQPSAPAPQPAQGQSVFGPAAEPHSPQPPAPASQPAPNWRQHPGNMRHAGYYPKGVRPGKAQVAVPPLGRGGTIPLQPFVPPDTAEKTVELPGARPPAAAKSAPTPFTFQGAPRPPSDASIDGAPRPPKQSAALFIALAAGVSLMIAGSVVVLMVVRARQAANAPPTGIVTGVTIKATEPLSSAQILDPSNTATNAVVPGSPSHPLQSPSGASSAQNPSHLAPDGGATR